MHAKWLEKSRWHELFKKSEVCYVGSFFMGNFWVCLRVCFLVWFLGGLGIVGPYIWFICFCSRGGGGVRAGFRFCP